jgi:hypothetical protein
MQTTLLAAVLLPALALAQPPLPASGDNAQLWGCDGGPSQQWAINATGYPNNHIYLPQAPGLGMDIGGWSNQTGALVHVWTITTTGWNQQWAYDAASGAIAAGRHHRAVRAGRRRRHLRARLRLAGP